MKSWGKHQSVKADRWDDLLAALERREFDGGVITNHFQPRPATAFSWARVSEITLTRLDEEQRQIATAIPDNEEFQYELASGLSMLHGMGAPIAFLIFGDGRETTFFLGGAEGIISELPRVLLAAIGPTALTPVSESALLRDVRATAGKVAALHGVPTPRLGNREDRYQLHRLAEGLRGQQWGYLVIADPVDAAVLGHARRSALITLNQISLGEDLQRSRYAKHCAELLEIIIEQIEEGSRTGLWQFAGFVFAPDDGGLNRVSAVARGLFGGADSVPAPFRVLKADNAKESLLALRPALDQEPRSDDALLNLMNGRRLACPVTSSQLAVMIHFPNYETPGFGVNRKARFALAVRPSESSGQGFWCLGMVTDRGEAIGNPLTVPLPDLTRHGLVAGVTGSGKTSTVLGLLNRLQEAEIPFFVIEPAKNEYRRLLLSSAFAKIALIYTLGDERTAPFRLNPFEFPDGISVQTHIDQLKSVFVASFVMYAPMPYVLEQCLQEVYTDRGWDLRTSSNSRVRGPRSTDRKASHPDSFPMLGDLYDKVDEVVGRLGYDKRISDDVSAALKTRIRSLRLGAKGAMLDVRQSTPMQDLLQRPVLFELNRLGDDEEKAFIMGLLLTRLYQTCEVAGPCPTLKHVAVVEEAHRLLRATSGNLSDPEAGNTVAKSVETFTNMLSEIRAYGEGIIVCEQIPTKLAPDIVKNTGLKIIHRTVSAEDRELLAGATDLSEPQSRGLSTLDTGQAVVFSDAIRHAVLAKISAPASALLVTDSTDQAVQKHMASLPAALPGPPLQLYEKHYYAYSAELDTMAKEALTNTDALARFGLHVAAFTRLPAVTERQLVQLYDALASRRPGYLNAKQVQPFTAALALRAMDRFCDTSGRIYGWPYATVDDQKTLLSELFTASAAASTGSEADRARAASDADRLREALSKGWRMLCRLDPAPLPGCGSCCAPCTFRAAALCASKGQLARRIALIPSTVWQRHDELATSILRLAFDELAHFALTREEYDLDDIAFCMAVHALDDSIVSCHPMTQTRLADALSRSLLTAHADGGRRIGT